MLIDFEKAFDTISWKFIFETLDWTFYKKNPWIKTFYNGTKSCVLQNGFPSDHIYLQGAVDKVVPFLHIFFLLCVDILGILIRNDRNIRGIVINGKEYKLSQYADDTSLIFDGSRKSMKSMK